VHPYRSLCSFPRRVYPSINNGVYRSGFASTQKAYEEAVTELFGALDRVEGILKDGREYLIGGKLTEADVRLYTTIVRFDIVYHGHFKCNLGSSESGFLSPLHLADRIPRHALIISYITLRYVFSLQSVTTIPLSTDG
jgi:glutathionyl-hydroquinone reductase